MANYFDRYDANKKAPPAPKGRRNHFDQYDEKSAASRAGESKKAREARVASATVRERWQGRNKGSKSPAGATAAFIDGRMFGLLSPFEASLDAVEQGARNLADRARGKTPDVGMGAVFDASRRFYGNERRAFAKERPAVALGGSLAGGVTGGAGLAKFIAAGAPKLVAKVPAAVRPAAAAVLESRRFVPTAARSAATGAGVGAVVGAGNAEPGKELQGAKAGAGVGLIIGGGTPAVARTAQATANAVGAAGRTVVRSANRVAEEAGGKGFLNPKREAAKRLAESLKADKLSPDDVRAAMNGYLTLGASAPSLLDVAGRNTQRLLRAGAAKEGGGADARTREYAEGVAADLQDRVAERAYQLTPGNRSTAAQYRTGIEDARDKAAVTDYGPAYAESVPFADDILEPLTGEPGRRALARARQAEEARSVNPDPATARQARANLDQLKELERRLNPPEMVPDPTYGVSPPAAPAPRVAATVDPEAVPPAPSLMTWIRQNGGLRDDGGELTARDLTGRGRGGKFQAYGVGNPNGMRLEDAAGRARDAGFFPDKLVDEFSDNYHPVTGDDLLEAMERELQGAPRRRSAMDLAREADDEARALDEELDFQSLASSRRNEAPPEVSRPVLMSGSVVDRLRIAMRNEAEDLAAQPKTRDVASGYAGRVAVMDRELDKVEGLLPARRAYRDSSRQAEAVDTGRAALNDSTRPGDYADNLRRYTANDLDPDAWDAQAAAVQRGAGVGVRDSIVQGVTSPAAGSTGYLNKLATGLRPGEIFDATFGPEDAGAFRGAVSKEIGRLRNARYVDPTTGSPSAGRLMDAGLVDLPALPTGGMSVVMALVNKVRQGATMTDAERDELARIGLSRSDRAMEEVGKFEPATSKRIRDLQERFPQFRVPVMSYGTPSGSVYGGSQAGSGQ